MGRISGNVIGDLTRVLRWGTATGDGDDRLLERFLAGRDESAFTALVARHGPMVLGVCRRVLRDEHDVEDAFQATFLVLVRSAGAIRRGELVGPWLHGVAHRVAVRARAGAARRFARERNGSDVETKAVAADVPDAGRADLRAILDAELARLPETLRAPLVLCYLEGLTHEQAAGRLRQPVGTIRSRLSRGRDRLRARLARRGVSADDAAWGSMVFAEPVSTRLFEATVRSVLDSTIPSTAATALVSATAASLAKGVLDAMLITKLKLAGACALGLVLTMGGVSGYTLQQGPGQENEKPQEPPAVSKSPESSKVGTSKLTTADLLERHLAGLESQRSRLEEQINLTKKRVAQLRADREARASSGGPESKEPGGKVNDPRPLPFVQAGKLIIVASSDGHVVTGYSSETGEAKSIRLAEEGAPELEVAPVVNNVIGALLMRGLEIHRVAAFNSIDGSWYAQDLVEDATKAAPIIGATGMACYTIGNRVYAFSGPAARWDVLELPDGSEPKPYLGVETISCQVGDHLHVFSIKTGKWTDIDTKVVSDGPRIEQAGAEPLAEPVADQATPAAPAPKPAEEQKADGTKQAEYLDPNQPVVVPSREGRVVTIFGIRNPTVGGMGGGMGMMMGGMGGYGRVMGMAGGGVQGPYIDPLSVRLAVEGDPGLEVTPVFSQQSIALSLRGEKIQRLAVFNMNHRRWDVQDLREPVKEAKPVVSSMMMTYALGRRLYTYSSYAGKWSALELPEGAAPMGRASDQGLTLRYGDKIHIYNPISGEWTDFNLQVAPEDSNKNQRPSR